jgi:hypothetical protein
MTSSQKGKNWTITEATLNFCSEFLFGRFATFSLGFFCQPEAKLQSSILALAFLKFST